MPVDDTHTLHLLTNYRQYDEGEERQSEVPFVEQPLYDEQGLLIRDYIPAQDQVAWIIQGPVSDRTTERLGVTDVGIIMFRRMLEEQMAVVADGADPLNTHRDEAENELGVLFPWPVGCEVVSS